jgi:hypothetical protein
MYGNDQFLGIVQLGQLQILAPDEVAGESVRLTGIQMQEAVPPETREIDLTQYEGNALMVSGHFGGGWIYAASVIDHAGPIVAEVVKRVFGQPAEAS